MPGILRRRAVAGVARMVRISRAVVSALVVFFAFGTAMCCLTIVLLLFPRTPLDELWQINPEAKETFGSILLGDRAHGRRGGGVRCLHDRTGVPGRVGGVSR